MKICHHPDDASLMSCSAGSMPEALAAVMAAHASICPRCREELSLMENIGNQLFNELTAMPVERSAPIMALRRFEADIEPAKTAPLYEGDVPSAIAGVVGPKLDDLSWKRLAPGIWHIPLPLSKKAKGDLRLIKVAPGQAMPEHGHGGSELTLVLRGCYRDKFGEFGRGDVADLSDDVEHAPIADPHEGCICLIGSVEKARFKTLLARIVQPLTGM